jgi:chloramphenicol O-acetyltransferase type A
MRHIDVETWPRRAYYRLYREFDQPHFNICANVDLTDFYDALKRRGIGFTVGVLYVLTRAANDIPAFRFRMRGDDVIEHDIVHPSTTVLSADGLFGFCAIDYSADFRSFAEGASKAIAAAKEQPTVSGQPDRDDVLFTTAIPWVSFTSFAHPTHLHPADSIPRLAWGKRFEEGGRLKMPLSVQGHHAMMDGLHVGQYFEQVQAFLSDPGAALGPGEA